MEALHEDTGEWPPTDRDWLLIASEVERLRFALERLPNKAEEIPDELISVVATRAETTSGVGAGPRQM